MYNISKNLHTKKFLIVIDTTVKTKQFLHKLEILTFTSLQNIFNHF